MLTMRPIGVLTLFTSLFTLTTGCVDEAPTIGKQVEFAPPPQVDLTMADLPRSSSGRPIVVKVPGIQVEYDSELKDAVTALAGCVELLMSCVEPDARSLDDCFFSSRKCETESPWMEGAFCCPSTCFEKYATLRIEGVEEFNAFEDTFFKDRTCFPGLVARLAEGR